jgi:hypothetical protein
MKKATLVFLLTLGLATLTVNATAQNDPSHYRDPSHGNTTGAPLDGGLLLILGSAGLAYYASRKQKSGRAE